MSNELELIFIVRCCYLIKGYKPENLDLKLRGTVSTDRPGVVHEAIR